MSKIEIYISGALTDVENSTEVKLFYESIGLLCEEIGLQAYIPHTNTDPINNPNVTPRQVFELDKHQVSMADLVIAYLGLPSFGVGMELAYAETKGIPVILLYEQDKTVSRFPRGIPTKVGEVQFKDYEDALLQLKDVLNDWKLKQLSGDRADVESSR